MGCNQILWEKHKRKCELYLDIKVGFKMKKSADMGRPLVSVIIPVYNASRYVKKAIESVLKQTYGSIEIIVVNDGSQDDSLAIVKEIAEVNECISVYSTENRGLSSARNYGFSKSKGKYILYMDSDDFLMNVKAVEIMVEEVLSDNSELLIFGFAKYYNQYHVRPVSVNASLKGMYSSAWNKMYARTLIDELSFPEGLYYEDMGFVILSALKARRITVVDRTLYAYVQRAGSIASVGGNYHRHLDVVKVFEPVLRSEIFLNLSARKKITVCGLINYHLLSHMIVMLGYTKVNRKELYRDSKKLVDFIYVVSKASGSRTVCFSSNFCKNFFLSITFQLIKVPVVRWVLVSFINKLRHRWRE